MSSSILTESLAAPPELHLALAGDGLVKIDRVTTELKRKVCKPVNLARGLDSVLSHSL